MKPSRLYLYNLLVPILPQTKFFIFKSWFLKFCGAKVGKNVRITSSARIHLTGDLIIGDNTWIGHEVLIAGGDARINIGRNVALGPKATIITGSHKLLDNETQAAGEGFSEPITIEDGVWIGANSTILGNVTIGECSAIGACSLINKSVSSRVTVAGVPAKVIKKK